MKHFIVCPNWRPSRLNQLMRSHWSVPGRLKKADAQTMGLYARQANIPKATGKRRVSLEITLGKRQRCADDDAYQKSTLDGLVKCGMLIDDRRAFCEWGGVEYFRGGDARTVIVLEDVP